MLYFECWLKYSLLVYFDLFSSQLMMVNTNDFPDHWLNTVLVAKHFTLFRLGLKISENLTFQIFKWARGKVMCITLILQKELGQYDICFKFGS